MSSASPHRSYGHKGSSSSYSSRNPNKRFVPKPHPSSSSSDPPKPTPPHPTLTTSLRASSDASSSSSSSRSGSKAARSSDGGGAAASAAGGGGGNFVAYLPQDEAVASGLGADAGGLDAVESQAVVDLLNDELANLLTMKPRDFWREVVRNDSMQEFLDSYLQFRHRWYDFPHRGARGTVAGVVVGELELCRRVFMVLYRISSSKDPGATKSDSLSVKEHTALLQEKKLLDLPKLLDICAIYGHDNGELTRLLIVESDVSSLKITYKYGSFRAFESTGYALPFLLGSLRHKFLRMLLPFWSSALPTLPVTAPPRKDNANDVPEGRLRHQRSSRMDPRKLLLTLAIMACMGTMAILYYRLAQRSLGENLLEDEAQ